jgi:hypothetical protein
MHMRQMTREEQTKQLTILFTSKVSGSQGASVVFQVLSSRWQYTIEDQANAVIDVPTGPFKLEIATQFQGAAQPVSVDASIVGQYISSLEVNQKGPTEALFNFVHTGGEDQCTVTCVTTGESRSGIGACIDCKGPLGYVRLCC